MIQNVPSQFIPLCVCLFTQRSLCQRSITVEKCRGEGIVGGYVLQVPPQERPNWG